MNSKSILPKTVLSTIAPKVFLYCFVAFLFACSLGTLLLGANFEIINPDSGFYIPISRLILEGKVPIIDIPIYYSPGWAYFFSMFGEDALTDPFFTKAIIYFLHLVNTSFIFLVLRTLSHEQLGSLVLSSSYLAWAISLDGTYIVLEPIMIFFLLLACFSVLYHPRPIGSFFSGLMFGFSIMVKQYSILFFPGLLLLVFYQFSVLKNKLTGPSKLRWGICFLLLLGTIIPFLAFSFIVKINPFDLVIYFASFGNLVASYVVESIPIFHSLIYAYPFILVSVVIALWLLSIKPSWINIAFILMLAGSIFPLFIRNFPHYAQLSLPWAIILAAQLIRAITEDVSIANSARSAFFILVSLSAVPVAMQNLDHVYARYSKRDFYKQQNLFETVDQALTQKRDVLVLGSPAFYFFSEKTPPSYNFGFASPNEAYEDLLKKAAIVVIFFPSTHYTLTGVESWVSKEGFIQVQLLSIDDKQVLVYGRPSDIP